jgi:ABC-type sugar transport system ATPase subunit
MIVSSDLPEILGMCDRVLVLREGKVAGELPARNASQEAILHLAAPEARA